MAQRNPTPIDPAAEAAALLRRLGFMTMVLAVPIASLMARRATVILVPIGTALLIIAALLDGAGTGPLKGLRQLWRAPAAWAGALLLGWAALSIAWTPFPASAADKVLNVVGMVAIAAAAVASLPDKMRSANLYLVPIGIGAAAVAAVLLALTPLRRFVGVEPEGDSLERGLVILAVAVWPAIAWLISRARQPYAVALGLGVAAAAIAGGSRVAILALVAGTVVCVLALVRRRLGTNVTATVIGASLMLAPVIPFLVRPFLKYFGGPLYPGAAALRIWADVMGREPLKLVTGHGLDTTIRSRFVGLLPQGAPQALPFEIWYELGVVGAAAASAALVLAIRGTADNHPALMPAQLAAFMAAFTLAAAGAANAQAWWLTALGAVVVTFVAIERGQFRTSRPKATFFKRPTSPP